MKATAWFNVVEVGNTARVQEAWGGISALLDAIGFAKTADTGQMVISSLTMPATNTYPAYEVRSFDDGYGALFMKWEYGIGSATSRPVYRLTFGTGSDGAGNITGKFFDLVPCGDGNAHTYQIGYQQYASLSNGTFSIALQGYHSNAASVQTMYIILDRQRNPDTGAIVPGGWMLYHKPGGTGHSARCYSSTYQTGAVTPTYAQANIGYAAGASSIMPNESATTSEIMPMLGSWPRHSVQPGAVFFWGPEMPLGYTFNVNVYGQTRTYLSIARAGTYTPLGMGGTNTNIGMAMVYE